MQPNIAVVVLDTVRADAFSRHFDWLPGHAFTNAYATANWSVPSHASLLTGRYPSEVGIHAKSPTFDDGVRSIAERLAERGYTTRMWTENGQLASWDGWGDGFDHVRDPDDLHEPPEDAPNRTGHGDEGMVDYVRDVASTLAGDGGGHVAHREGSRDRGAVGDLERIRGRIARTDFEDPEFLLLNVIEAHSPYDPPAEYVDDPSTLPVKVDSLDAFDETIDRDVRTVRDAYDGSVAYLSDAYREIFRELRSRFDYVITMSDHGELLGEHGMWGHDYGLYPELTHVPLVVSGDDVPDERTAAPVSILDVHATIARLAGIDADGRGRSLLDGVEPVPRLTEYDGTIPWRHEMFTERGIPEQIDRLDRWLHGVVTEEYYAYETFDGFEVVGDASEATARAELETQLDDVERKPVDENWSEADDSERWIEDTRRHLQDMGYL